MTDVHSERIVPVGPIDPEAETTAFIGSLERTGYPVTEIGPIPPVDHAAIEAARTEARLVAGTAGRASALSRAQEKMAEWTLSRYQRAGFRAAYLVSWLDEPERRLEVVSMLVDAATAYSLLDLLADETAATLVARFDVSYGGPVFRATPEESTTEVGAPAERATTDGD